MEGAMTGLHTMCMHALHLHRHGASPIYLLCQSWAAAEYATACAVGSPPPSFETCFCRTDKLARQAGARVVTARRGRACQMNAGAEVARGDILCFVHADSRIPRYHPASKHRVTKVHGAPSHRVLLRCHPNKGVACT